MKKNEKEEEDMKWFEHHTDSINNSKIEMLIDSFGIVGYGIYFATLEIIGKEIEKENAKSEIGFIPKRYTLKFLSRKKFNCSEKTLKKVYDFMAEEDINLIDRDWWINAQRVYCPKLLDRADKFTRDHLKGDKVEYLPYSPEVTSQPKGFVPEVTSRPTPLPTPLPPEVTSPTIQYSHKTKQEKKKEIKKEKGIAKSDPKSVRLSRINSSCRTLQSRKTVEYAMGHETQTGSLDLADYPCIEQLLKPLKATEIVEDLEYFQLASLFAQKLRHKYDQDGKSVIGEKSFSQLNGWAREFRLTATIGHKPSDLPAQSMAAIEEALEWALSTDCPYSYVIQSAGNFRGKMSKILIAMANGNGDAKKANGGWGGNAKGELPTFDLKPGEYPDWYTPPEFTDQETEGKGDAKKEMGIPEVTSRPTPTPSGSDFSTEGVRSGSHFSEDDPKPREFPDWYAPPGSTRKEAEERMRRNRHANSEDDTTEGGAE